MVRLTALHTHWAAGYVEARVGLDAVHKRNLTTLARSPVAMPIILF